MAARSTPPIGTEGTSEAPRSLPGRAFNAVKSGIAATPSAIVSAGSDFKTRGGTVLAGAFGTPISFVWHTIIKGCAGMVRDTLWGKKPLVTKIEVEKRGLFGKYKEEMELDDAVKSGYFTLQQIVESGKFTKSQLEQRGYGNVEIPYTNWTGKHVFKGTLRDAIDSGHITIDQAIVRDLIKKEDAIEGGLLKLDKSANAPKTVK